MTIAQAKKAAKWTAAIAPSVALVSFLLAQGFCVAPWQTMSRAESKAAVGEVRAELRDHESKMMDKLDRVETKVDRILGALRARGNTP